jgi:hypothetical protein
MGILRISTLPHKWSTFTFNTLRDIDPNWTIFPQWVSRTKRLLGHHLHAPLAPLSAYRASGLCSWLADTVSQSEVQPPQATDVARVHQRNGAPCIIKDRGLHRHRKGSVFWEQIR